MLGISWVATQLTASQEGLSSMSEWVIKITFCVLKFQTIVEEAVMTLSRKSSGGTEYNRDKSQPLVPPEIRTRKLVYTSQNIAAWIYFSIAAKMVLLCRTNDVYMDPEVDPALLIKRKAWSGKSPGKTKRVECGRILANLKSCPKFEIMWNPPPHPKKKKIRRESRMCFKTCLELYEVFRNECSHKMRSHCTWTGTDFGNACHRETEDVPMKVSPVRMFISQLK
jgi:hypothetical protein